MQRAPVIGIVGTAKNTGKTTTLAALSAHCVDTNRRFAVTGIGYDGEAVDTVTMLPKPRLLFREGVLVATSQRCLVASEAGFRVLSRTGIETPLGEVAIAEITREGRVVVAGPNTLRSLRSVVDVLDELAPELILVDGSLNRIAPMSVADRVVFATGAARAVDPQAVAGEMTSIDTLFRLPLAELSAMPDAVVLERGSAPTRIACTSLHEAADARAVGAMLAGGEGARLAIPGCLSLGALAALGDRDVVAPGALREVVLRDPIACLLAGDATEVERAIASARAAGILVTVAGGPRLAAVTVNPFYPRLVDHRYVPDHIDKGALLDAVARAVGVPAFNIRDADAAAVLDACLDGGKTGRC